MITLRRGSKYAKNAVKRCVSSRNTWRDTRPSPSARKSSARTVTRCSNHTRHGIATIRSSISTRYRPASYVTNVSGQNTELLGWVSRIGTTFSFKTNNYLLKLLILLLIMIHLSCMEQYTHCTSPGVRFSNILLFELCPFIH